MKRVLFIALTICLSSMVIFGQATSGVTGSVTDAAGAVVPGVQVTLADTKTSRELTTTTNSSGSYSFNNVAPGDGYRLTFTGQGFQTYVINNVVLGIATTQTHNAQLTAGQVTETVEVVSTSGDATLNTTDASIGNIIGRRQLRELPIQIRSSPAALIGLQPGAVGDNVRAGGGNRTGSVTGARADQGNITVDGIDANDVTTGQPFNTVANAPIDSIQEFRAVTSGPNASEGRSSGGQIQLTTNSGTNEYHGSLREYWRHEQFAANTFFNNRNGVQRPALRRHQYGGSLGGPLPFFNFGENDGPMFISGKDKLFFFFDYEARRDRSQVSTSRTVPLEHFRNGQIAYILATSTTTGAACPSTARLDTRPDCIGFFTPSQIQAADPLGIGVNQQLLQFINQRYPLPNDLSGGDGRNTGLIRWNAPNTRDDQIVTTRFDATPSDNQRFFARFTLTRRDSTNALEFLPGDGDSVTFQDRSYSVAGGHTWIIASNFTNVATVGLSRSANFFTPPDIISFPNSFSGGPIGSPFPSLSYQDRKVYVPTIRDDMTYTTGSHTFQFGASYKPIRQNPSLTNDFNFVTLGLGGRTTALNSTFRPANIRGGSVAAFDSAYAYLLGRIASVSGQYTYAPDGTPFPNGSGRKRSYAYNEYEFYFQDNWKIRSDLSLNLGVRYHLYPPPYEVNGFQADHTASATDFQEFVERRIANAAAGIAGEDAEPFLSYSLSGAANDGAPLYKTDWDNFAPRVGFAWNPSFTDGFLGTLFGDRKSVVRGNYSLVYDRVGGAVTFIQDQINYLFDNSASLTFGNLNPRVALATDPRFTAINSLPVQPTPPVITTPFTPFVSGGVGTGLASGEFNYTIDKNFKIPYSHSWNFGIQREIPGNMILDVSYVGRLGKDLFVQADASQVMNFKDTASGQFMFDALNAIQPIVQANVLAGATPSTGVTAQPWIENQVGAAVFNTYGVGCNAFGLGSNCTQLVANFQPTLVRAGGTGDLIASLYANGLLNPNVGMSSQFAVNAYITNLGESEYHGMLVSLQKRLSRGFEFEVNYTWSHSIDNQSSIVNTVSGALLCDITNPQACRGNSDFDIRHLFNANYIWDLPFGRGRAIGGNVNRWVDTIIGGWTLSGIASYRSGLAISSASGSFPVSFFVNSPAILVGDPSLFVADIHDEAAGIQYFADPEAVNAALRYPHHGEIGSRNLFRSPSLWSMDMGLSKKIAMPWSENHKLTLRVDAFNVFNTNSFSTPNLTLNSTSFGRITSSLSAPRELQWAIRYDF